jgi:toxin ParE1/3/4
MTRLVVTAPAESDVIAILTYLAQEAGLKVAEDYERRFGLAIERLVQHPAMGAPRPQLGRSARMAIVWPYLLVYDYVGVDDTLTLLRVLHGRRKITPELLRR